VNVDVTNVLRISRRPAPIQIVIEQKQLENVEYFNYLCTLQTSYATCTQKFKSIIVMAKASYNRKRTVFTSKLELKF